MKRLLGLIFGILLLFAIIFFSGGIEVLDILKNANLIYFGYALGIQLLMMILYATRLQMIVSEQKYHLKFRRIFKILLAGMAVNQLTPVVKAGGEPVKGYYLSKSGLPLMKSSASVVVEITSELVSFYITLILVIAYLAINKLLSAEYLLLGIIVSLIFLSGFIFAFRIILNRRKLEKFIKKYVLRFFKTNSRLSFTVSSSIINLIYQKRLAFKIYALSFFCRILEFIRIYFVFHAINYPITPNIILLVWALGVILSMVPWLPGGLGLIEGGTISTLFVFGIPATISSSMMVIDRFLNPWISVVMGSITILFLNKEIKKKKY